MEGLHYLPRVQTRRGGDDSAYGENFLECESCKNRLSREERATLACGYLDSAEWAPGLRPYPEATVCPGYSIRLPEVLETSRALLWANRGELRLYYEPCDVTPLAKDCIDLLDYAIKGTEGEILKEHRDEMRNK